MRTGALLRLGPSLRVLLVLLMLAIATGRAGATEPVRVGSKRFTESYVLGEIVRQTFEAAGVAATHQQGLGNTAILQQALAAGAVQVYPEYTGTIVRELLEREGNPSLEQLNRWLEPRGLKAAVPLGFNNTYALALREADAVRLGVATVSDLARLPAQEQDRLRFGFSHEFLARTDGWPGLKKAYALPFEPGSALDHGLAYQAMARGQVDVIDVYSTDAQIERTRLRVLRDDRGFFPRYDAVLLMRIGVDERPLAAALEGRIDEKMMIALNAQAELDGRPFAEVARGFLARSAAAGGTGAAAPGAPEPRPAGGWMSRLWAPDLGRLLAQHLALVFGSVALAAAVGVPLGVWAFRHPRAAGWLMAAVGLVQTVPSLAMLTFLIAVLGTIGFVPALVALFVYALLPIVRNTHAGLQAVPPGLAAAGLALGLRPGQVLRLVQLPLALPTLLAGVKTSAVINVGTATVAAFVGAGGLGERIVAGLAVNDTALMLAGALPAALLALLVQGVFDALERAQVRHR